MENLTIGKIASQSGTAIETIRYYEREGLIAAPGRTRSGYRQYPPEVIRRLQFIRHAKELGFSLREIRELLSLRVAPGVSCGDIKARAQRKIADVRQRIAALKRVQGALEELASACSGRGPTSECPILGALENAEPENGNCTPAN